MTITEGEPVSQVCAGGAIFPLVQIQHAEIVETQCLAGGVTEAAVFHERLHRQTRRFAIVAHRFLDQRQVVEHCGGIVRIDARRGELERLGEEALRVVESSQPQGA